MELDDGRLRFRGPEDWQVMAFGNFYDDLLGRTFTGEIFGELLPQEASMSSDDAVFTRVISGCTTENMDSDLLLGGFFGSVADRALANIK
jgi:hypothetical protein